MKKVVKVSVGNLAFTMEEDAFLILKGYLKEIEEHYGDVENGKEIAEGIEERVAELFTEKCAPEGVITLSIVNEVIAILGRASTIDSEQGEGSYPFSGKPKAGRKLYRNPEQKVLGGVCSGLAAFFSIDVTLMRLLFIILFIGFSFFGLFYIGGASIMIIAYIVLWIIIPEATTVEQRCAMYGEPMNLSTIQNNLEREIKRGKRGVSRGYEQNRDFISKVGRVISVCFSLLFIFISLVGIASLTFLLTGVEVFKGSVTLNLLDYIDIGAANPLYLKIFLFSFLLLPLIGILYLGIKMLFRFRTAAVGPGVVILLLWIVSLVGLGISSVQSSRPYWNSAREEGEIILNKDRDTLYIEFAADSPMPSDRVWMEAGYSSFATFWIDQKEGDGRVVFFPNLKIVRQSHHEQRILKYRTDAFSTTYSGAIKKAAERVPTLSVNDSIIRVSPIYFDKSNKWDATHQQIYLYLPKEVEVIIKEPLRHDFDKKLSMNWLWQRD